VPSRPVAVLAALLVLLAGCSEKTRGNPSAGDGPTGQTTDESTPDTSESATRGGIADLQPCAVLDDADLTALGLTSGEEKDVGSARVCRYRHDGASLAETFTVSIELFDSLGLADLNASDIQQLPKIGSHDAASFVDPSGGCGVSIGVTDKSRVDNAATGGSNQQLACQLATQLATVVERKLP
jgi:hypothetical protein